MTRVTSVTWVTMVTWMTRVTGVTLVTWVTRVTRFTWVTWVSRVTGVIRLNEIPVLTPKYLPPSLLVLGLSPAYSPWPRCLKTS